MHQDGPEDARLEQCREGPEQLQNFIPTQLHQRVGGHQFMNPAHIPVEQERAERPVPLCLRRAEIVTARQPPGTLYHTGERFLETHRPSRKRSPVWYKVPGGWRAVTI